MIGLSAVLGPVVGGALVDANLFGSGWLALPAQPRADEAFAADPDAERVRLIAAEPVGSGEVP